MSTQRSFCSTREAGGKSVSNDFDVIIIGGGPAGSVAALQCLQQDIRTAVLERARFPRERPGETLHPAVEPLLKKLGVADLLLSANFIRHEGNWVKWQNDLKFVPFGHDASGPWRGFQAVRAEFDEQLLRRACEAGAQVFQPCPASKLLIERGRVCGVITPRGAVRSRWVIDASGSQHWLAKQLGLKIERYSPPLVAWYGYAEGTHPPRDDAPAIVGDATGWTWTAGVRPHLYQWTRLSWEKERLDKNWIPAEFKSLTPCSPTRGADVTWRTVERAAGSGYFIVGDASAVLDPASSHGVLKGIMSGMLAAHTISVINGCPQQEWESVTGYCNWVRDWFMRDVSNLRKLYSELASPPEWLGGG
ncbi:MAG: NAD(P)/FAD-dependent oxidoreductase [Blastocatellia bacterium]